MRLKFRERKKAEVDMEQGDCDRKHDGWFEHGRYVCLTKVGCWH